MNESNGGAAEPLIDAPVPFRLPELATSGPEPASDDVLSPAEAHALLRATSRRAPTGIRNRALIVVMYRSGLRPGEALALFPRDVDVHRGMISVPPRKGGTGRVVGLDRTSCEIVGRWLERRARLEVGPDRHLFCTLAGEPLKAAYVRELLPRLARKAGITKRVHPLGLRYANAAELAVEGFPTALIDRHLGVAVTGGARRYLRQYSPDEVVEAIARRDWGL